MSYLVLARKWRPQNFDELIGQESVAVSLKNALAKDTVAHAYLFSGPRGVGKTSTARILASALNCTKTTDFQPCGQCHHCRSIANSSSVDVLEIDGASNNSVDNIRELRETVQYAPSTCRYKVYIIDEIHMLTDQAFNALLKTLEEPPPHVIFIFATTSPKKIPSTIVSRCQHFIFRKVQKSTIKTHLTKIAEEEKIPISPSALEMIARASDGCMRDSLTLLDQVSSFSDEIHEKEVHMLLGLPEQDVVESLAGAIISGDVSQCLTQIRELAERGYDFRTLSREIVAYFRNLAIINTVKEPEKLIDFTPEEIESYQNLSSQATVEELTLFLDELFKIESLVKNASFPRYVFELGLIKASFIKGMASVGEILKTLASSSITGASHVTPLNKLARMQNPITEGKITSGESGKKNLHNDHSTSQPPLKGDKSLEAWKEVTNIIKKSNQRLAWFLEAIKPSSFTESGVTFTLKGGMGVHKDHLMKSIPEIEKALTEVQGKAIKVMVQTIDDKPQKEVLKESVMSNPVVEQVMKEFDGKLINVKPL